MEVEDETHFMLSCAAYSDLRRKLWTELEQLTGMAEASFETNEQKMNALIGERFQPEEGARQDSTQTKKYRELMKVVMRYITEAMKRRRGQQR